jgi:hypothetical protein
MAASNGPVSIASGHDSWSEHSVHSTTTSNMPASYTVKRVGLADAHGLMANPATSTDTTAELAARGDVGTPWDDADAIAYGTAPFATTFRALWSAEALFVRWDVIDDRPWWTMTHRDDRLWEEEAVELFLDLDRSGTHYAEVEISPANVVCDVHLISASPRRMDLAWDLDGLQTNVVMNRGDAGLLTGWTAVARLPWDGFRSLPSARSIDLPPRAGDRWRFNVFRIKRPGGPSAPEEGAIYAAWSPVPGATFHEPAAFRDLEFR